MQFIVICISLYFYKLSYIFSKLSCVDFVWSVLLMARAMYFLGNDHVDLFFSPIFFPEMGCVFAWKIRMVLSLYLNSKCLNEVIIMDWDMYGVNPILDANVCGILVQAPVAHLCSNYGVHSPPD